MRVSPVVARLSLLGASVSAIFAAPALWRDVPPTSVEIVAVRPLVADWCEEGTHLEVDVRVHLAGRVRDWRRREEGSWLEVERRAPGDEWRRQGLWTCGLTRWQAFTLPAGTTCTWTEWVDMRRDGERELRFVLDVEAPSWFGLPAGRVFAASEPFRPAELLARIESGNDHAVGVTEPGSSPPALPAEPAAMNLVP